MKKRQLLMAGLIAVIAFAPRKWGAFGFADEKPVSSKNQPELSELDPEIVAEMAEAAEHTYEAIQSAYHAGTARSTDVCIWSRRWLDCQRALAKNHQEEMTALRAHRDRMRNLFRQVNALFIEGVRGGEAERFHEAQYYLAEATALVEHATPPDERGPTHVQVTLSGPEGMVVQWGDGRDQIDSKPLVCPATHDFRRGRIYRMLLSNLPGFKGLKARATLEMIAPWTEPLPIGLSTSDAEAMLARGGVTRVFYATDGSEVQSISGNWSVLDEAERKGTVLAILQVARR